MKYGFGLVDIVTKNESHRFYRLNIKLRNRRNDDTDDNDEYSCMYKLFFSQKSIDLASIELHALRFEQEEQSQAGE